MKKSILFYALAILMIASCADDDGGMSTNGSFEYTVSGAATAAITGDDTNFGTSNGEFFIRLTAGTDELIIRILKDPIVPGAYTVNPILVNQQAQPIEEGDSFADLGLGSVFTGGQKSFSTNAGNSGLVTLSNVTASTVTGTFNMSLLELLGGGINQPEINIQGQFTAVKQ